MDIVICTDNNYVMPYGVLLCSVCENNKQEKINFHAIVDQSFSDNSCQALSEIVAKYGKSIKYYKIKSELLASFPVGCPGQPQNLNISVYYRLFLTEFLPKGLSKVLYLDGDIIVRGSLKDLWNIDIDDYAVGTVPDMDEGDIYN